MTFSNFSSEVVALLASLLQRLIAHRTETTYQNAQTQTGPLAGLRVYALRFLKLKFSIPNQPLLNTWHSNAWLHSRARCAEN